MTGTNMRPANKSPPFLVIGLLVALGILAFNYWNLSGRNRNLTKQVDALQADLRFASDKHLSVEKLTSELTSKLSESDAKLNRLTEEASEKVKKIDDQTAEVNKLKSELQTATANLEESKKSVEQLQNEKRTLEGEMGKVVAERDEAKKVPVTCNQGQCRDVIRDLTTALTSQVAKASIRTAFKDKQEVVNMIEDLLQGPDQIKSAQAAEQQQKAAPAGRPQAQVVEQGHNVIKMQQPQAPAEGHAYGGQGVGGGGVGSESNRNDNINVLAAFRDSQQLQQQQQQQLQQQQQELPRDTMQDMSQQAGSPYNVPGGLNQKSEGNAAQIVPQNIPQPGADDGTANNAAIPNIANDPAAQEDVSDNHHLELPEDDMDKQAIANKLEELGNLGNLHNQLQDLSKNDRAVDETKGGEEEEEEDDGEEGKEEDADVISQDKPLLAKKEKEEEEDYDEHDLGPSEKRTTPKKGVERKLDGPKV